MNNKEIIKQVTSYWYVLLIIPILIIAITTLNDSKNTDNTESTEINMVIGFYISGESFSDDIINDDISDTLGLCSDNNQFYYLVDYNGFGNTEFFTGANYSRKQLNISEFMPYDSNELNLGDKTTFIGFANYVNDIDARFHCLIIWGHGKGSEGVCFDGSSSLKANDIENILIETEFDMVAFDACEMGSLEFLNGISKYDGLVVASEKDIPDRGIDYAIGFSTFIEMRSNEPYDLGKCLVDSSIDYYKKNPSKFSVQLSIIDLSEINELHDIYNNIDPEPLTIIPEYLESGLRVDLNLYLSANGIETHLDILENCVLYTKTLQSSTGVKIEGLCGISVIP